MVFSRPIFLKTAALLLAASLVACSEPGDDEEEPIELGLQTLFPTDDLPGETYPHCLFTSPQWYENGEGRWVLVARSAGVIEALDPDTGAAQWSVALPEPDQGVNFLLADPAIVGDKMIVAYQSVDEDHGEFLDPNDGRLAHLVAVIDLAEQRVDPDFPVVELEATVDANEEGQTLSFRPSQALTRSDVIHARGPGDELGKVYLGQGNTRDIQPWHGWAWEIDLDRWRDEGSAAAISGVMTTTPEPDANCGEPGSSGSQDRICGGGLWAPSGHLVVEEDDGYHLIMAPGNGQLDLERQAYANTLMKIGPGLNFDPRCDAQACADYDVDEPSQACIESCQNLFIPRMLPDQQLQRAPDGRCDDHDTMFECWGAMDYIGGSTPVSVEFNEQELLVYPTKDGHAYLVDGEQLGLMYDRHRLVEMCGHNGGECSKIWAGMSVTKPVVTEIDGAPAVLIATFMPDQTNPAGLVALKIVANDGAPTLERAWEFPDFDDPEAVSRFRNHPSRVALGPDGEIAWLVDIDGPPGLLSGVNVADGELVYQSELQGRGRRYVVPLVTDDRVYVPSCNANSGPGRLEAYKLVEQ